MSFAVRNHYVPQWYQRRFLTQGRSKLFYLDQKPDVIKRPCGTETTRQALRHLGPINCFKQDHLYTLYFGQYASDVIEKGFFGRLDSEGEKSVRFFSNYSLREGAGEAYQWMGDYLAAQLFRTPKGLGILRAVAETKDHQKTLMALKSLWRMFNTIWAEGVWEIVQCDQSPTKFIITDSPVTTYNRDIYPGSAEVREFGMARIERVGTHTIFPIDSNRCLIITNLQHVRNPKGKASRIRENPRYFAPAMFDLRSIQRKREISEQEVLAINRVMKVHSERYIAAEEKEWLFPERYLSSRPWPHIGGKYFLMPDPCKIQFHTSTVVGFKDGGAWGINEYGHQDLDGERAQTLRKVEWGTFQASKKAWDERDRLAGREPPSDLKDYW